MANKIRFSLGMPTDIDVKRLTDTFGVPAAETMITYAQIEEVLKVRHGSSRFQSVTHAWRKKLEREHNVLMTAVPNKGYRIADVHESVGIIAGGFKKGIRTIKKAGGRAVSTPRTGLSTHEIRTLDYVANTSGMVAMQAALNARKLRELPPEIDTAAKKPTEFDKTKTAA